MVFPPMPKSLAFNDFLNCLCAHFEVCDVLLQVDIPILLLLCCLTLMNIKFIRLKLNVCS
jgi:hypothetical protein